MPLTAQTVAAIQSLPSGAARWKSLGNLQGAGVKQSNGSILKGRPAANAQPADIAAWLTSVQNAPLPSYGVSPVFAYPEFGWKFSGDNATASYSLGSNNSVQWTATSSGAWTYKHEYGGFDVGTIIDDAVNALTLVADISGFVFAGMFLSVLQAAKNGESLDQLGQALKQDWDVTSNTGQLAFAIYDGDWEKAWKLATADGSNLSGIVAAWSPSPAPDANGNLTVSTAASKPAASSNAGINLILHAPAKPPTPKAPMSFKLTFVQPAVAVAKQASQAVGLSPPPNTSAVSLAVAGAPTPASPNTPWYQKTLFTLGKTPVSVAESGGLVGAAAALWKWVL